MRRCASLRSVSTAWPSSSSTRHAPPCLHPSLALGGCWSWWNAKRTAALSVAADAVTACWAGGIGELASLAFWPGVCTMGGRQ